MRDKKDEIERIEETQRALQASIDQTKKLADKAETLLQQHKDNLEKQKNSDA
jgi:hypothetical protein